MSILSEEERLGRARIFFGTLAQIFPETNVYFNDVIIHLGMEYIPAEDYSLEFEMGFEKEKNSRQGREDGTPPPHRDFKERGGYQSLATLVAAGHTPVGRELVARVSARRKFSEIRTYLPWGRPCFHVLSE